MALLDILKKKKDTKKDDEKSAEVLSVAPKKKQPARKKEKAEITPVAKERPRNISAERFSHIIIRPRITEKASTQSGGNSYTFEVARHANKIQIKQAIKEVYNVEPVKVNVISMKPKQKMVRNMPGKTSSYKKAIVYLKDGDRIEFI